MTGSEQAPPASDRLIGQAGQRQVHLPLRKAFGIALKGIQVRFWRSMITAAGVLLGIAFLAATLGQSVIESHQPVLNEQGLSQAQLMVQKQEAQVRQVWLVSMSLIVSAVGITNSMLMSVTERFKEIGTMKCLGALDSFIVRLFLLEAGFLGVLASLFGFTLGFSGSIVAKMFELGWNVWKYLPPGEVLGGFVWSVTAGTLLTVLATIFPAYKAAQLPPAAALRSEI